MAQTLPKDAATERLRWLQPYLDGQMTLKDVSELSPFSYRTLKRWIAAYREHGIDGLIPLSRKPHSHPSEYGEEITKKICTLRKKTNLGPDVLIHLLAREGINASRSGIGKLLKREKLSRSRKRIQKKVKWISRKTAPGELVETDVVYVRKFKGKWLYQFTAIDSCTRWRYCWVTSEQSNRTALVFLEKLIDEAPFKITGIKTDNASIFTNRYTGYVKSADPMKPKLHAFDRWCKNHDIVHYLIDPGKPQQNGKVERSHRTDRERFWRKTRFKTLTEARSKHREYMTWYNDICPHLGINGLTPTEKLAAVKGTNECV